jgi:putative endonuclease
MKERRYYVYIMASKSRCLYTGITNNLYRRALEHKSGEIEGFTKRYKIHRLVYYEVFRDVGNAIAREKEIKGWDRAKRVALIERDNFTWEDLAEDWGKDVPIDFDPRRREVFSFSRNEQPVSDSGKGDQKQIPRRCAPRDDSPKKSAKSEISNSKIKV